MSIKLCTSAEQATLHTARRKSWLRMTRKDSSLCLLMCALLWHWRLYYYKTRPFMFQNAHSSRARAAIIQILVHTKLCSSQIPPKNMSEETKKNWLTHWTIHISCLNVHHYYNYPVMSILTNGPLRFNGLYTQSADFGRIQMFHNFCWFGIFPTCFESRSNESHFREFVNGAIVRANKFFFAFRWVLQKRI